jgi:hypothetical protein
LLSLLRDLSIPNYPKARHHSIPSFHQEASLLDQVMVFHPLDLIFSTTTGDHHNSIEVLLRETFSSSSIIEDQQYITIKGTPISLDR